MSHVGKEIKQVERVNMRVGITILKAASIENAETTDFLIIYKYM